MPPVIWTWATTLLLKTSVWSASLGYSSLESVWTYILVDKTYKPYTNLTYKKYTNLTYKLRKQKQTEKKTRIPQCSPTQQLCLLGLAGRTKNRCRELCGQQRVSPRPRDAL